VFHRSAAPVSRGWRHTSDEGGAAIVEFALVMPLLLALVFGMLSGGISYNRKLALTNAVREGSRYGSTLAVAQAPPLTPACVNQIDCWLAQLATITVQAAEGELGPSVSARQVCVAYVYRTAARPTTGPASCCAPWPLTPSRDGTCFTDGRGDAERRVQVSAQRDGKLELVLRSTDLKLTSQSVTRFEAITS
jgi:hypothetical protein